MANQKVEICLKKKNPPRAQRFRYFRYESRNKKTNASTSFRKAGLNFRTIPKR